MGDDIEAKINELAEALCNHDNLSKLGQKLGMKANMVSQKIQRNVLHGNSSGTRAMLFAFKDNTRREDLIPKLVKALEDSDLEGFISYIADERPTKKRKSEGNLLTKSKKKKKKKTQDSRGQDSGDGLGSSSASLSDSRDQHRGELQGSSSASLSGKYSQGRIRRKTPEDKDMKYEMWDSDVKGHALIMYNHDIAGNDKKKSWWRKDVRNMKTVLDRLDYIFPIHPDECINHSRQEMISILNRFIKNLKKKEPQSAVVFISSHGDKHGVVGSDNVCLTIPELLQMFSSVLLGKPKVIVIDACWGGCDTRQYAVSSSGPDESSSPPKPKMPENADLFLIHATSVGKYAWNCTREGSWLVQDFCDVVYSQERELEDLDTIMLRVTDRMRTRTAIDKKGRNRGGQSTTVLKQGVNKKLFF